MNESDEFKLPEDIEKILGDAGKMAQYERAWSFASLREQRSFLVQQKTFLSEQKQALKEQSDYAKTIRTATIWIAIVTGIYTLFAALTYFTGCSQNKSCDTPSKQPSQMQQSK